MKPYILPTPAGFVTRIHKDGILVQDGGEIISVPFLTDDTVKSTELFTTKQMHAAYEAGYAEGKK